MNKRPKELLLIITAMAGYLAYEDAGRLFQSISNRNRVIRELKEAGYISVISSKGLRTINLLKPAREHVRNWYPDLLIYEHYTGDLETKKRRCTVGKLLTNMSLMGISITKKDKDSLFLLKMDGAGSDRGYRNGRMVGIYSTPDMAYMTYQLGSQGIRWNDRREMSQATLTYAKLKKETGMLIVSDTLEVLLEILQNTDLPEREKRIRNSAGTQRIHLSGHQLPVYFVCTENINAASLEMKILADLQTQEMFQSIFGSLGESVLIPFDLRKLYGLWKETIRQTVYVQECYEEYVSKLLPAHQVIGVPAEGIAGVLRGE